MTNIASNSAFNTQGATPGTGLTLSAIPTGSPQGAALSSLAQTSTPQRATYAAPTALNAAYGATQGTQTGYASSSTPGPTVGNNPGLLPRAPSQPVASHTATDAAGNTVTQKYVTPDLTKGTDNSSGTSPGLINNGSTTTATPPAYDPQTGQITDYGKSLQPTPSPYAAAVNNIGTTAATGAANITNASQSTPQVENAITNLNTLQTNEANSLAENAKTPQEVGVGTGRAAYLQGQYGSLLNAGQTELSNALTEQNQGLTGATSAANLTTGAATTQAGATAPQPYGLTTQPYNPTTDTYGGGSTGGAIGRASTAANIGSAGTLTTDINSTTAAKSTADSNFQYLNSIASQGGISSNVPAINALNQKYSNTVGGSAIISAFQNQLSTFLQNYATITGTTPVDPNSVTLSQLQTFQQTLDAAASNKIAGDKTTLSSLGNSSSDGSTSSTFGGSAWQ